MISPEMLAKLRAVVDDGVTPAPGTRGTSGVITAANQLQPFRPAGPCYCQLQTF